MQGLQRLRDRIRDSWWGLILSEHDTEPTEMAGGMMKILIGLVLLSSFDTFGGVRVYTLLSVFPETIWALLLLGFGVSHLLALRSGRRPWRHVMALSGFLIWFIWSISFFWGVPANTGGVVYLLAAMGQGWCAVRLRRVG